MNKLFDIGLIQILAQKSEQPIKPELEKYITQYGQNNPTDTPKYYRFLHHLAPLLNNYIELGIYQGWTGLCLLDNNPNIIVHGFDIYANLSPEIQNYSQFKFHHTKSTDIHVINQFEDQSIDAILIDSDHTYETTKDEYNSWYNKIKTGGLILFDDILYPEFGCSKFWNELNCDKIELHNLHPVYGFGAIIKQ